MRSIPVFVPILLFLFARDGIAQDKPTIFYVKVGSDCDVYERAGTSSSVLVRVKGGQFLPYVTRQGNSYNIEFISGRKGFISGACIESFMDEAHVDEIIKTSRLPAARKVEPEARVNQFIVIDRAIDIYETPGPPFKSIAKAGRGDALLVTGFDGNYYRVTAGEGKTGFVTSIYVSALTNETLLAKHDSKTASAESSAFTTSTQQPAENRFQKTKTYVVIDRSCAVYATPNPPFDIMVRAKENDTFIVNAQEGSFYKVEVEPGKAGWLAATYVKEFVDDQGLARIKAEADRKAQEEIAAKAKEEKEKEAERLRLETRGILPLNPLLQEMFVYSKFRWKLLAMGGNAKVEDPRWSAAERRSFARYSAQLLELTPKLQIIGSTQAMFFTNVPFRYTTIDQVEAIIADLAIGSEFNTIRSTAKTRASKVISTMILPEMEALTESFKATPAVGFFGILVTYGSRDFLSESGSEPESVCLIVSRDDARGFVKGQITDNELLRRSQIFASDRDTAANNFRRVELKIE
ncbi:MAG TPA: hypothetical protein VGK99_17725 [Acidobacteriota bacterium]|jgi:uncharacterized protein YgiM (DUF1202 family)